MGDSEKNPFEPTSGSGTVPVTPTDPAKPTDGAVVPDPPIPAQNPATTAQQRAVDGGGAIVPLAGAAANALANQIYPLPSVSLQLKAIDQKELRTFSFEYNSRKAVQRTYRPQGFFGLSQDVLDHLPKNAFLEVDTNSEFWRKFDVKIHGPQSEDFQKLGLTSAAVQVDYGDPASRTNHVSKSFGFNSAADAGSVQTFSNPMFQGHYDYQYTLTYAFNARWTGEAQERDLAPVTRAVRDVFVLPQRDFKFVVINASFAGTPDWTTLSQIHLFLRVQSQSATWPEEFEHPPVVISEQWMPSLAPIDPAQQPAPQLPWRVRFKDPDLKTPVTIRYWARYFGKDGSKHETKPQETTDPNIVLDPAPRGR